MPNQKSKNISSAFDECLQMDEQQKRTPEAYLNAHPQHKQELTALLNITNAIKELKDINPSENFYKNSPERITTRLVDQPVTFFMYLRHILTKKPYRFSRRFKMAQFFVTLILLISLATGGVYAADGAGPGDWLYGLAREIDQVRLILESDPEVKASTRLGFAADRLNEAKNEIENGDIDNALIAFKAYDHMIDQYAQMLVNEDGLERDKLKDLLTEALNIHQEVLANVWEMVPDEAKEAIENALGASLPMIEDLPVGPPDDIVPGQPVEDPPGPPADVPSGPPVDGPPGKPENIPPNPPVDVPPAPPVEIPVNPGNGMP